MAYLTLSEIADRVRDRMKEEKITQSDVAERLEISQPAVSRALEGGSRNRSTLLNIARELRFSVDEEPRYLFEETSREERNE
ncbi:hypothetical protein BSZ35_00230 [Salinibacter sp. 10B]|uniref:helix-turn-helix domain-containing protein n=1 Tax=Salinibacter sp. 10B TaxID=1923971 RepID=UPI000CF39839|nr:helix-turn-helix transcriptional regulator [Salinibacter sp. 10B]PQJ36816.1 hypothetical protein BSZ35_00230 [Salinibacter sp. 10B]